ncbi:AraC family transcriptional regulator [Chryseobacterium tructae]|uniref:Helix-turn-helix domain-containing protein n=1 Tax=Chryseobacterium tructae TaxID=1037380 RepID=A0ABV7XYA4_9FLAO|nr:AraC family transcriptional regulator [Chryseobacterium tructae]MDN3693557.1 AraC family transcriptional regulator [Chryseobacterium tructae]
MKKDNETVPHILKNLAYLLGAEIKQRKLEIPLPYGSGYCTGFIFNEHIRMLISNYKLNENIIIENPELNPAKKMLFFKFQNVFSNTEKISDRKHFTKLPSVLIGTSRLNTDNVVSIHTNTETINIEVDADYLRELFQEEEQSVLLKNLLQNTEPFLFEQLVYPSLQNIVDQIISEETEERFRLFFLRIKAEELICRLLMELEKRNEKRLYALNTRDIETIYEIKEQILAHLEVPPVINDLAVKAGMSPTKLKRLFKQIFGDSIFSYYQGFRMKEAAFLLREKKHTVSEVGYAMGFTNLSHFSKIFNEHIGMKPKQYSMIA